MGSPHMIGYFLILVQIFFFTHVRDSFYLFFCFGVFHTHVTETYITTVFLLNESGEN